MKSQNYLLKKLFTCTLFCLLAHIFWLGAAYAVDYYVDLDAGSNGDGSIGSPWNTMSSALKSAGTVDNGDTVYVRGTSSSTVTFNAADSGASGAVITYIVWPGYAATWATHSSAFAFIMDADYITLDGFTMHDSGEGVRIANTRDSTGVTVKNCTIYEMSGYGGVHTGYYAANDFTVENCTIHDIGQATQDHGMYLVEGSGVTIKDNTIYNNACNGIQINIRSDSGRLIDDIVIERNLLYGAGMGGYGAYGGSGDCNGIILMDNDNDSNSSGITNAIVRNNIIFQNSDSGINARAQTAVSNWIVNNTLWDNGQAGIEFSGNGDWNYANNIYCDNDVAQLQGSSSGTATSNLPSNPGFVSELPGNADFMKLAATATTAIDQGIDAGATDDYFGTSRPQGSSDDIGAHEYCSSGCVSPPTPSPNSSGTDVGSGGGCFIHSLLK